MDPWTSRRTTTGSGHWKMNWASPLVMRRRWWTPRTCWPNAEVRGTVGGDSLAVEEVVVDLSYTECLRGRHPDAVLDHQPSELLGVDEDDAGIESLDVLERIAGEAACRDEDAA